MDARFLGNRVGDIGQQRIDTFCLVIGTGRRMTTRWLNSRSP